MLSIPPPCTNHKRYALWYKHEFGVELPPPKTEAELKRERFSLVSDNGRILARDLTFRKSYTEAQRLADQTGQAVRIQKQ